MSRQGLVLIALHVGLAIAGSALSGACLNGAPSRECQQDGAGVPDGPLGAILEELKNPKNMAQLKSTEDISALFQSQSAQVLTARVPRNDDPIMVADQIEAPMRPGMQKLMEINTTVHGIQELIQIGASPELAEIIQKLLDIIKDDLLVKVTRDQTNAQTELDTRIDALTKKTEIAVSEKADADQLDKAHDQCVTEEKRLLVDLSTCKVEEAALAAENATAAYCSNPDLSISYKDPPQLQSPLTVDFSKGLAHVRLELDLHLQPVSKWIASIKLVAAHDQIKWDDADEKCQEKSTELEDKMKECGTPIPSSIPPSLLSFATQGGLDGPHLEAWRAQHEKCLEAKNTQKISLCEFGHAYQNKCAAKIAFDKLKADIIGSGTIWSESDREKEWTQVHKLECTMEKFRTSTGMTPCALDECTFPEAEAATQFTQNVGRIDKKQTTYDALTSEANFTCAETYLTIGSGALWTVPETSDAVGWIPTTASYTKATGHMYAIESDSSKPPFAVCLE